MTNGDHDRTTENERVMSRRLLATAASGFVLSAGGLFLPELVREMDAKGGVHGGVLGGRHGKNRRGQHKHRHHGDRKDERKRQDSDPGGGRTIIRDIAFEVHNGTTYAYQVKVNYGDIKKSVGPGETANFDTDRWRAVVECYGFAGSVFAENFSYSYPKVWVEAYKARCQHDCDITLASAYMSINQVLTLPGLAIKRLADDDDHIRFRIDF